MVNEKGNLVLATIVVICFMAVIAASLFLIYDRTLFTSLFAEKSKQPIACTQEAKLCPDGSYVGRTGPNCEFTDCPTVVDETAGWQTYTNTEYGFEVKYPENFSVNKNSTVDNIILDYSIVIPGEEYFVVKIKNSNVSLEQNVKKYVADSQKVGARAAAPLTVTYKPYIINNLSGYLITEQSGDVPVNTSVTFKIQEENNIFSFNYSYQGYILWENPSDVLGGPSTIPVGFQDEVQARLKVYNQIQTIISTFKFIK